MSGTVTGDPAGGPWHLDKRVPIALITAIMLQTGAGFFWAGAINHRVASIETRQNLADARVLDQAVAAGWLTRERKDEILAWRPTA